MEKQPFVPPNVVLKKPHERLYPNSRPTRLYYFSKYFPENEYDNMAKLY